MKRISDVSPTSLYVAEVPIVAMCGYSITSSVCSRNESEMATRLAGGFKLDIGNPVALAAAQAGLFILALEG
jgi:hypothetical protein